MLIKQCFVSQIQFQPTAYPAFLKESLIQRGLCFPIHVKEMEDGQLICVDGSKRLSAIHDILMDDPNHKLKQVSILCTNHARSQSGTAKNHH